MSPEKDWGANAGLGIARDFMEGGIPFTTTVLVGVVVLSKWAGLIRLMVKGAIGKCHTKFISMVGKCHE